VDLIQTQTLAQRHWAMTKFDDWAENLRSVCGHFDPVACDPGQGVYGVARQIDLGGLKIAHVVNNLERIYRSVDGIRRDVNEHLFLVVQVEGACGVEQGGCQSILDAGDCILVDSTRPLLFSFGGRLSNHVSLHLPRQTMYAAGRASFEVAQKIEAADPMAVVLRALIAKLMAGPVAPGALPQLQELLFNAVRQAFSLNAAQTLHGAADTTVKRLELAGMLIDRNLTEAELGVHWLAQRLGVSIRTLQDDFRALGQTCTAVIRDRRLRLARERVEQARRRRSGETIAEIAYSTGFNDISYFNRSFRELFGCAPGDLLKVPSTGQ